MFTKFARTLDRHDRIALQLSGGKDSLAILHGAIPWLDRICVYWMNPGNPFPETVAIMDELRQAVPHFKEVPGRQRAITQADGWPSDVVPIRWTTFGQFTFGPKPFKVQGRLDCCFRSLMEPMHQAMIDDGITCIIRGKRSEEADKTPTRTGSVIDGIEFVYPIWDWKKAEVEQYLIQHSVPIPPSYEFAKHSLDCMDCTAWWGEGLDGFLQARYPEQHVEHERRLGLIRAAVATELMNLENDHG